MNVRLGIGYIPPLLLAVLAALSLPAGSQTIQPGELLINEILSNPKPGGVDFVEIYNHSDRAIDLRQVSIASVSSAGRPNSARAITTRPTLIEPHGYCVLTTNPAVVKRHYPAGGSALFVEMLNLPNFNNETGGVVLYRGLSVIDSLFYTPAMKSPFITDHRGISLERQQFAAATLAPGNFHSAATSAGGATPGYANSRAPTGVTESDFALVSKTFSPDGDGYEDRLEINYRLPESGFMANIEIFDDKGRLVRRLQRNQLMATQGTITWDGLSDTNQRLPMGIYIAAIELYHTKGIRKVYRKSFVLAARL